MKDQVYQPLLQYPLQKIKKKELAPLFKRVLNQMDKETGKKLKPSEATKILTRLSMLNKKTFDKEDVEELLYFVELAEKRSQRNLQKLMLQSNLSKFFKTSQKFQRGMIND